MRKSKNAAGRKAARDHVQPRIAQHKIQYFRKIDYADICFQRIKREKPPHKQSAQRGIENVHFHIPHMLPQPFETAVYHHVGIHHGYKRCEKPDKSSGFFVFKYPLSQNVGQKKKGKRNGAGKGEREIKKAVHAAFDLFFIAADLRLRKLRNDKL